MSPNYSGILWSESLPTQAACSEPSPAPQPGSRASRNIALVEVDYFLRGSRAAMRKLVAEVFDPGTRYEYELPVASDIARALELDARFKNLGLGLVDGMVAAIAERRQIYRVLTTDRRDFSVVRVGPRLTRALELVP